MTSQKRKISIYAGVLLTAIMFCIPAVCGETTILNPGKDGIPPQQYKPTTITCVPIFNENSVMLGALLTVTYYYNGASHTQNMNGVFSAMLADGLALQTHFNRIKDWNGYKDPDIWTKFIAGTFVSYHMSITENVDNLPTLQLEFIYPLAPTTPIIIGPVHAQY